MNVYLACGRLTRVRARRGERMKDPAEITSAPRER